MIRIYRETGIDKNLIQRLRYFGNKILKYLNIKEDVVIVLVDDKKIINLNKKFFNKNTPTNVISFEIKENNLLGEIYISIDTAIKEAEEWGVTLFFELIYLIIHGILHLIGYNDLTLKDEKLMEDKEIEIVKALNLNRFRYENKNKKIKT